MSEIRTESETKYIAVLCSRIPNNHCELCSHFVPEGESGLGWNADQRLKWVPWYTNCTCPSCDRGCSRFFLPEDQVQTLIKRVPDNWITKAHDDARKLVGTHPTQPRPNYSKSYWAEYIKARPDVYGGSATVPMRDSNNRIPPAKKPEPVPVNTSAVMETARKPRRNLGIIVPK